MQTKPTLLRTTLLIIVFGALQPTFPNGYVSSLISATYCSPCLENIPESDSSQNNSRQSEELPITINLKYVHETVGNFSGGERTGHVDMDNVQLFSYLDMEQILGVPSTRIFIHPFFHSGLSANAMFGTLQGVSNIETQKILSFMDLWVEKKFLNDDASLLFGLFDLNSEFDAKNSSALFVTPSQGIGSEFGMSGSNGPSIYPHPSLALRLSLKASERITVRTAVLDGKPDCDGRFVAININKNDGLLFVSQISSALSNDLSNVAGVGGWLYTARHPKMVADDPDCEDELLYGDKGAYVFFDSPELKQYTNEVKLGMCARIGFAQSGFSHVDAYGTVGLSLQNLISENETIGVALATGGIAREYQRMEHLDGFEMVCEATYAKSILPWLRVQPTLVYVVNPSSAPGLPNAFGGSLRIIVER